MFRAVVELSRRHGFAVWVTGYVGDRSAELMRRHLADLAEETPPLPTDPALGDRLRRIYAEAGCWTWFDDYAWPPTESFHRFVPGGCDRPGRVRQLNAIWLDWTPPQRKSALRRWLGRLRRKVTPARPDR